MLSNFMLSAFLYVNLKLFLEQRTSNYEGYFSFLSRIFLTKTMSKTISKKKEKEKSFCQKYNGRINFTHTHNGKSNVN